ncbi:MAG: hypothetical protein IJR15_05080 [Clostridiales bacterium]|nr:hypothetical protein [Clostridiales bacterium]
MSDTKEREKPEVPVLEILKHNFLPPRVMTWGWPLMLLSIMTAAFFAARCLFKNPDLPFPAASVVGCSFLVILETLCALVLPAVMCSRGFEDRPVGHFTGVGALILSFISGIPLTMIRVPLYNALAWVTLRLTGNSVYPVFFHGNTDSPYGVYLSILCDVIIPAFGASIFFFGLLWCRFKSTDRFKAIIVITAAFVLYSMDFTSTLAIAAAGIWCCYLRSRIYNMWAPFLCLISMGLCEMFLPDTLARIDIFNVQTYADIGSTYFYSSLPSFFMGMVLLLFFIRMLDSFSISLRHEVNGSEDDDIIPPFDKSINLSLLLTMTVFIVVWVLIFKGVFI